MIGSNPSFDQESQLVLPNGPFAKAWKYWRLRMREKISLKVK